MTYALGVATPQWRHLLTRDSYDSAGVELAYLFEATSRVRYHYYAPTTVTRQLEAVEAIFRSLANQWEYDTRLLSSLTARTMHPAYQEIIKMGTNALPLILRELERDPNHWFAALRAITGTDPVKPSERGDLTAMTKAWLRWARQNNITW